MSAAATMTPAVDAAVKDAAVPTNGDAAGAASERKPRGDRERRDEVPIEEIYDLTKPIPKVCRFIHLPLGCFALSLGLHSASVSWTIGCSPCRLFVFGTGAV
jgi:hypothetical protein